jgi:hypothetical protein
MTEPFSTAPMQFGVLQAPRGPQEGENTFRWATVTSTSPLRVRLDGEVAAVPATPDTLFSPAALHVNERVWVQMFGRRLIILGVANFGGGAPVYGTAYQTTVTINSTSTTPVTLCSFTLPSAGVYDITYVARAQLAATNGYGMAGIYDSTGTLVPNSEIFPVYNNAAVTQGSTATGRIFYTATGAETLTLRGRSASTFTIGWTSSTDGRTGVAWSQMPGSAVGPTGLTGAQGPAGDGFPPTAFTVDVNTGAYGTSASFAAAGAHPGFTIVTNAQTDGPIASTYFVCETWLYQGPTVWSTQFAWSPFGSSTGPDTRKWMRQMYGGSGNIWGPWEQIAGPVPWIAPTFTNSWVDYGSGFQTVGYRKVGDVVQLRGLMKNGTLGASAFTLPVGYRPTANILLTGLTSAHASVTTGAASAGTAHTHPITGINETAARVDINAAAGTVIVPVSASNGWVSLDGLSFATT